MRAERRHHQMRAYLRQRRILQSFDRFNVEHDARILNRHINCGCMGRKDERRREIKRGRRAWRNLVDA